MSTACESIRFCKALSIFSTLKLESYRLLLNYTKRTIKSLPILFAAESITFLENLLAISAKIKLLSGITHFTGRQPFNFFIKLGVFNRTKTELISSS